jgi:sulfoxide reductase heme-binding subunit YedZ
MHLTSSPLDWYVARAGGVVAYVLLSAVVALGLTMTGAKSLKRWPRFALEDVHRFGGLMVGAFLVLHIGAVAIDSYLPFSLASLVVPLTASYRPIWTALGIVAAELLLALAVANHYYRARRLSHQVWRRLHYLNFAVWSFATLHGLGSGTDRSTPWLVAIYGIAVGTVSGLIVWRVIRRRGPVASHLRLMPVAASFVAVALVLGLSLGPFKFRPKPWNASTFRDSLSGRILTDNGVTQGIVSMAGVGTGAQQVMVRADLLITPQAVTSTEFQMEYLPSGAICRGSVTGVHNLGFDAICHLSDGSRRVVHAEWPAVSLPDVRGGFISSHA